MSEVAVLEMKPWLLFLKSGANAKNEGLAFGFLIACEQIVNGLLWV
jgi:hypothetical protein